MSTRRTSTRVRPSSSSPAAAIPNPSLSSPSSSKRSRGHEDEQAKEAKQNNKKMKVKEEPANESAPSPPSSDYAEFLRQRSLLYSTDKALRHGAQSYLEGRGQFFLVESLQKKTGVGKDGKAKVTCAGNARARCRGCRCPMLCSPSSLVRVRHAVCNKRCCNKKEAERESKKRKELNKGTADGSHSAVDLSDICGRWHFPCLLCAQQENSEWFKYSNPQWRPIDSAAQLAGYEELTADEQKEVDQALEEAKCGVKSEKVKREV